MPCCIRSFSAAGLFVTKIRSSLSDDMLDNLCVLRGIFLDEKKERRRKEKELQEKKEKELQEMKDKELQKKKDKEKTKEAAPEGT